MILKEKLMSDITYIHYNLGGQEKQWGVGAHPGEDTIKTLKAHLAQWIPDAVFVKAEYHNESRFVFQYGHYPNHRFQSVSRTDDIYLNGIYDEAPEM